jgi:hypothetical protein
MREFCGMSSSLCAAPIGVIISPRSEGCASWRRDCTLSKE